MTHTAASGPTPSPPEETGAPGRSGPDRVNAGHRTPRPAAFRLAAFGIVAVLAAVGLDQALLAPRPGPLVLRTGTAHYLVAMTVGRARTGTTALGIRLDTRAGAAVDGATVRVQPLMPLMGHADPPLTASATGPGQYRTPPVDLMMTGPWEFQVSISGPNGSSDTVTLPLSVSG